MSTIGVARQSPGWVGDRTRLAGSAYLALAGLANVATGLWLFGDAGSGWAISWSIDVIVGIFGELGGLERGSLIDAFVTVGIPGVAAVLVAIGAVQLVCSWTASNARGRHRAVGAAALGCLNPLTVPVGAVAAVLFRLAREQFDGDASSA